MIVRNTFSGPALTPWELARAANAITKNKPFHAADFTGPNSRLNGNHCDCGADGDFVLLPTTHPDVKEGCKRYMQCQRCGGWSHL